MKHRLIGTLAIALGLSACASTGMADPSATAQCRPDAAAKLVGKAAPDDATMRRQTGSTVIRRIAPGDPVTQDYRAERITVAIRDGRVVETFCG